MQDVLSWHFYQIFHLLKSFVKKFMWNIYIEITNIPLKIFVTIMMGQYTLVNRTHKHFIYIYICFKAPQTS